MTPSWIKNALVKYEEGDLVAVPLEKGGYGVALVARWSKKDRRDFKEIICYGFDRLFERLPTYDEVKNLQPTDAILLSIGGDRAIAHGHWPRLGPSPSFSYDRWPLPPFRDMDAGRPLWFVGDDLDLVDVPNQRIVPADELEVLPPYLGIGTSSFLEWDLDAAVRRLRPEYVVNINNQVLEKWRRAAKRGQMFRIDGRGRVYRVKR